MRRPDRKRQQGEDDQGHDDPHAVPAADFVDRWPPDRQLPARQSNGGPEIITAENQDSRLSSARATLRPQRAHSTDALICPWASAWSGLCVEGLRRLNSPVKLVQGPNGG